MFEEIEAVIEEAGRSHRVYLSTLGKQLDVLAGKFFAKYPTCNSMAWVVSPESRTFATVEWQHDGERPGASEFEVDAERLSDIVFEYRSAKGMHPSASSVLDRDGLKCSGAVIDCDASESHCDSCESDTVEDEDSAEDMPSKTNKYVM